MEKITVTHQNFDECKKAVINGSAVFVIPSAYKTIYIDSAVISKFSKSGKEAISKDASGSGFRVQQGKSRNYIFNGGLICVKKN